MVTLPSVNPQSQQTGGFSTPGVTPMRSAVGEQLQQLGSGAQAAATGIYQAGLEAQNDYDSARATELETKLSNFAREKVSAFLRTTGRDSQAGRKAVIDELDAGFRQLQKGIENPTQESRFSPRAARLMQGFVEAIDQHEAEQTKTYKLAELSANAKEAQRMFLFWQRPGFEDKAQEAFDAGLTAIDKQLSMQGIPQDSAIYKQTMLAARSAMHGSVLKKLADAGDTKGLKTYYETIDWQNELTAETKAATDAVLQKMETRDGAVTAAMALDQLPYAERVKKLDEQLKAGALNEEQYQLAVSTVESREARAHRVSAQQRSDLLTEVNTALDLDRKNAVNGPGMQPQRTIDEILPAPLIQKLEAAGLRGVTEQYALRGRRLTTPEGVGLLRSAQADPVSLRGVPWDVIADSTWMSLDERDTDRLGALWAAANSTQAPTKQSRGGDSANGLTVLNDADWVDVNVLDKMLGALPEKPTQPQLNERKQLLAKFEQDMRRLAADSPTKSGRELAEQFVAGEMMKKVRAPDGVKRSIYLDAEGNPTAFVPEYVASRGELIVEVPDGQGNVMPVSYADIRKEGIWEQITVALQKRREAALAEGDQEKAARIQFSIASRSEFDYAVAYGELKHEETARMKLGQLKQQATAQAARIAKEKTAAVDAAKARAAGDAARQAELETKYQQMFAAQRQRDAAVSAALTASDLETAWRAYDRLSPASYNHPWWSSYRRWAFLGSEQRRRAWGGAGDATSVADFYQWHGIPVETGAPTPADNLTRGLLDVTEAASAILGSRSVPEVTAEMRRQLNQEEAARKKAAKN